MIYNKHNFEPGQVLKAQDLNEMEDGIVSASGALNLLDNSDFSNPVNQRGKTSYTEEGYTIDRWETWIESGIANVSLMEGYISINFGGHGSVYQKLAKGVIDLSKQYSLVIKQRGVSPIISYPTDVVSNADNDLITLADLRDGNTMEIEWCALYEGEYTAETLPPYVPKGYAAEMLECQRYFVAFRTAGSNGLVLANGYAANTTTARVAIPLSVPMRTTPTITSLNSNIYAHGNGKRFDVSNVSILANARKQIILQFTLSESTTASSAIMLGFSSPDNNIGYQALSADL